MAVGSSPERDFGRRPQGYAPFFQAVLKEELEKIRSEVGSRQFEAVKYELAARLFAEIIAADDLSEFLNLRANDYFD